MRSRKTIEIQVLYYQGTTVERRSLQAALILRGTPHKGITQQA